MVTLRAHYEPLNSNWSIKCECIMEIIFFYCKCLCTVTFGIRPVEEVVTKTQRHNVMSQYSIMTSFERHAAKTLAVSYYICHVTFVWIFFVFSLGEPTFPYISDDINNKTHEMPKH